MPYVTGLTPDSRGKHVLVALDGVPWRRIPAEVAVRSGLAEGLELGRTELRDLRRELRRSEAIDAAAHALRHRERSRAKLRDRLDGAGVAPWARDQALDVLARAGLVDDERFAHNRARALAERGSGDALIRADLLAAGIGEAATAAAIHELEPERTRAARHADARGHSIATARWLARRGFPEDAIGAALPKLIADES